MEREQRREALRKDRKCGVDKTGEDVKNEEVGTNGHLASLGDGQLQTILVVRRDN